MLSTKFNSVFDLLDTFKTEQDCIDYIERYRWKGKVISPFDSDSTVYKCKNNNYRCRNTGKYFNVKTGTLFDSSKVELRKWFLAIWLCFTHKKGISSIQLAKDISVTQKTAWLMLQKIRHCLGIDNDGTLNKEVEADETFLGGKNKNRHKDKKVKNSQGRSFKDKTPVLGLVQREKKQFVERNHKIIKNRKVNEKIILEPSRIIAKIVPDTKADSLQPLILKHVKKGSLFLSDEWHGYTGCDKMYNHQFVDHAKKQYVDPDNPKIHTNTIEGAWRMLKNSVRDMYNNVSKKHLQKYVDEFVFRYNTKNLNDSNRFEFFIKNCNFRLTYKNLVYG